MSWTGRFSGRGGGGLLSDVIRISCVERQVNGPIRAGSSDRWHLGAINTNGGRHEERCSSAGSLDGDRGSPDRRLAGDDVPWGDTLNVRKYPSSKSQKQSAYPNGTVLQMTGRCTDGIDLLTMAADDPDHQRAAVRYRWCEIWHDPGSNGSFATGWVYGRYIRPL